MATKKAVLPSDFGELSYNEANKNAFLKAGRSFFRRVIKHLQEEQVEFVHSSVSVNRAGIACSGEVYLHLLLPDKINRVSVQLSASCLGGARRDRVVMMLQHHVLREPMDLSVKKPKVKGGYGFAGSNQWYRKTEYDSAEVAEWVARQMREHPNRDAKKAVDEYNAETAAERAASESDAPEQPKTPEPVAEMVPPSNDDSENDMLPIMGL